MSDTQEPLHCPGCGEAVQVSSESTGQLVRCPYCNTDFFASVEKAQLDVVDDTPPEGIDPDREAAFDKLRIEHFTALRMGAIRARSWWLIATCMSALIVLDMVGKVVLEIMAHAFILLPILRILLALAAAYFARRAYQRAAEFKREINQSAIQEITSPPDFSTLDNGSNRWKYLEDVR